jgi:hypothetical protein
MESHLERAPPPDPPNCFVNGFYGCVKRTLKFSIVSMCLVSTLLRTEGINGPEYWCELRCSSTLSYYFMVESRICFCCTSVHVFARTA